MIKFKDSLGNLGLNSNSRNKSTNTKEMAYPQEWSFFPPVVERKALPKLTHRAGSFLSTCTHPHTKERQKKRS